MTPTDSATLAAWGAAVVAFLFGGAGFVVGLVGLHHARQAKEAAASANLIAKEANALSKTANALSKESNGIAREANEFSRESKDRENELHDVTWEWSFGADTYEGMVEVLNVGKMIAADTTIQFRLDHVTEATSEMEIIGRAITRLEIPGLRETIADERERRAASEIQRDERGFVIAPVVSFQKPTHFARLRVSWRTPLGASRHFDTDVQECTLPE